MEDFEEMKLYWNQLAEKNKVDNETNKKILEAITTNRYRSLTGKMLKEGMIGLIVIMAIMIFLLLDRYHHILAARPMHEVSFCVIEGLALLSFLGSFMEILYIDKFDFSMDVTKLRRKISNYKKYVVYSYRIMPPVLITIVIGTMIYMGDIQLQYTEVKIRFLIVFPIIACFIYLMYRHEMKHIKQLENFIDDEE